MIKLQFENNQVSIECLKQNQAEMDLHLDIKSYGITVTYSILAEKAAFIRFLHALKRIYETLTGETELRQRDENNYISFAGDGLGHVLIAGAHIDFTNKGNACQYRFAVDQTVLPQFIKELNKLNS